MNPKEGARKQIEIYKRMTGSERLRIVFELWEMALAQIKASEKALHPDLSEEEISKRSRKRMRVGTISCN
jgi:ABC-type Na+ transport system ATPase subunit NatA